jgi:hypothetical protein
MRKINVEKFLRHDVTTNITIMAVKYKNLIGGLFRNYPNYYFYQLYKVNIYISNRFGLS